MTIMAFQGKISDIIALIAKLNGITLGEYISLKEMREREIAISEGLKW